MSTVEEIEDAIAKLSPEEFVRLREPIQQRFDEQWDRQFEKNVAGGRLDQLGKQALEEHRAGRGSPFPPDEE